MTKIISIANQKGGVGKTTVTRELSACCALRGYKTLVIDCDPQGNLTESWINFDRTMPTLAHALIVPDNAEAEKQPPLPLVDAIIETEWNNLDIVPSDIKLARFEMQPDYLMFRLKNQLESPEIQNDYDLVFLDCPPQLGKLLTTALYATQHIIVPCSADAMGLQGLSDLAYTVRQIKENVNAEIEMLGAVMNLYKPQRNLSAEARNAVEEAGSYVGQVFDTNIHDYSKIAEAPSQRKPVVRYAPNHKAAEQFENLTDEVLAKLKLPLKKLELVSKANK